MSFVGRAIHEFGYFSNITCNLGLGQYSHYQYTIDTEINDKYRYSHNAVLIQPQKNTIIIESSGSIISHLTFIQLSNRLKHIKFDFNYVELIICELNYGTHYTGDHFALALVFVGFNV